MNCESAYRATVSRRRKCRWSWPEPWRTSHPRCRHTINPFVAPSRSIVSGTFRDTGLKVAPARVERWIFSASNKTEIYLPRLLWQSHSKNSFSLDNIYLRIDFNVYESVVSKDKLFFKMWKIVEREIARKIQVREYPFDNYFIGIVEQCPRIILQREWKFVESLKILQKNIYIKHKYLNFVEK